MKRIKEGTFIHWMKPGPTFHSGSGGTQRTASVKGCGIILAVGEYAYICEGPETAGGWDSGYADWVADLCKEKGISRETSIVLVYFSEVVGSGEIRPMATSRSCFREPPQIPALDCGKFGYLFKTYPSKN